MHGDIKKLYHVIKELSLLFAGALLGIVATLYNQTAWAYRNYLIFLSIILILIGVGLLEWLKSAVYWIIRKMNARLRRICIYAPYVINENNSSWIDGDLEAICNILNQKNIRHKVSKTERSFKAYAIIVNPFGGNYPEKDFSQLTSLNNIFEYVKHGGTYINIADIPFYYAYDENLKRSIDTTPLADGYSLERPFLKSILTQKLNHYV
ncbi:MAG: hypothetical protein JWO96_841 [Candidatus Saccharibacteria bacterium]|nr:hypothetical protein [Candidatus Saccharibacteria bacterium]